MTKFLFEHYEGCTPLKPCANCLTVAWLRAKLKHGDFEELIKRAEGNSQQTAEKTPVDLASSVEILRSFVPARVMIAMQNENVETIGDLVKLTEGRMMSIPNFGRRSLRALTDALASVGHHLGEIP